MVKHATLTTFSFSNKRYSDTQLRIIILLKMSSHHIAQSSTQLNTLRALAWCLMLLYVKSKVQNVKLVCFDERRLKSTFILVSAWKNMPQNMRKLRFLFNIYLLVGRWWDAKIIKSQVCKALLWKLFCKFLS